MKTVELTGAAPRRGADPAEPIIIRIDSFCAPDFRGEDWQGRASAFYQEQAVRLCDALYYYLPGGTLDQLLAELCRRKASLLRVAQFAPQEAKP